MSDNLNIFGEEFQNVPGIKVENTNGDLLTFIRPQGTLSITSNGTTDVTNYASVSVNLPSSVSLDTLNVTQNGTYTPSSGHAYSPVNVNILGAGVNKDSDVLFFDYDGTLLYGYSAAEFANLTVLPPNPTHTGLTAQGWNWTLSDAKTYVQTNGFLDIGQNYITSDGATRLYIKVEGVDVHPDFSIRFSNSSGVTTVIDWGDSSATTTSTETSMTTYTHNYSIDGDYVVTLTSSNALMNPPGTINFPNSSNASIVVPDSSWQRQRVIKIEFGSNLKNINKYNFYGFRKLETVTIPRLEGLAFPEDCFEYCGSLKAIVFPPSGSANLGNYAFRYDYSLERVSFASSQTGTLGNSTFAETIIPRASIPNSCSVTSMFYNCRNIKKTVFPSAQTSLGEFVRGCGLLENLSIPNVTTLAANALNGCQCLKSITLNSGITVINGSVFQSCYRLYKVTIPEDVTSIGSSAFNGCSGLTSLTIPSKVTSIAAQAFNSCSGIMEYHLEPTTPPTLANTNAFSGIATACVIYVPKSDPDSEGLTVLDRYKAATNWSTYASRMQEEPD